MSSYLSCLLLSYSTFTLLFLSRSPFSRLSHLSLSLFLSLSLMLSSPCNCSQSPIEPAHPHPAAVDPLFVAIDDLQSRIPFLFASHPVLCYLLASLSLSFSSPFSLPSSPSCVLSRAAAALIPFSLLCVLLSPFSRPLHPLLRPLALSLSLSPLSRSPRPLPRFTFSLYSAGSLNWLAFVCNSR